MPQYFTVKIKQSNYKETFLANYIVIIKKFIYYFQFKLGISTTFASEGITFDKIGTSLPDRSYTL